MLPPLLISVALDDGATLGFVAGLVAFLVVGGLLFFPVVRVRYELRLRDGFLITALGWGLICLLAAVPLIVGEPRLSPSMAVFEAVSGLTTTGATVLTGIDALPDSVRFYRQLMNFVGGMGIIVLAVAILPMLRIGGLQLFTAEKNTPSRDSKLTPRVAETAKTLWLIYLGLNALCALAYWMAGMAPLDALGHAFSTVATAGFSTHDASIGHYDSVLIEAVAIVFMLVGATNFAMHYWAWHRATTSHYFSDTELRSMLVLASSIALLTGLGLVASSHYEGLPQALRHALFHTVSHMTTTGFAVTDFASWPAHLALTMILIAFVGGCIGSTTGGMKLIRVLVLFKHGLREILRLIHPRAELSVKIGPTSVPEQVVSTVLGFFAMLALSFVLMAIAVAATGVDMLTAVSVTAACLSNLGPALGAASAHYGELNPAALGILSFAMILGRLEFFTLLVLVTPAFWRS